MDTWDCEECGRRNREKDRECVLCGERRGEGAVNPATLLRVASVELSHRFGRYVDLRHYGGGLTAEAARELIAGAERELEAERESGVNGHAAAE